MSGSSYNGSRQDISYSPDKLEHQGPRVPTKKKPAHQGERVEENSVPELGVVWNGEEASGSENDLCLLVVTKKAGGNVGKRHAAKRSKGRRII